MSRENVEAVRAVYAEWEKGNLGASLDLYDRDVLFMPGPDWTDTGRYLGREGIREFTLGYLDAWTNLTYAAEELIEAENSVVVAVHQRGVGTGSGAPTEWQLFVQEGEALEAAGLRE